MPPVFKLAAALVGALVFAVAGLATFGEARARREPGNSRDVPWAAPGRRLRVSSRPYGFFSTQGAARYMVWVDARGRTLEPGSVAGAPFRWLEASGATRAWDVLYPDVADDPNPRYDLRVAPYAFVLVSVDPAVVVMSPDPMAPRLARYVDAENGGRAMDPAEVDAALLARRERDGTFWQPHWERGRRRDRAWAAAKSQSLPAYHLSNEVAFITEFPDDGPLLWFSPELRQLPTPVPMRGADRGEIPLPDGALVLTRADGVWSVERR